MDTSEIAETAEKLQKNSRKVVRKLQEAIVEFFKKTIEPEFEIYTTLYEPTQKISFHLLITNIRFSSMKHLAHWAQHIISLIPEVYRQYIDKAIYTNNRLFRLLGSSKSTKRIPKIIYEYNGKITRQDVEDSLIMNTNGTFFYPYDIPEKIYIPRKNDRRGLDEETYEKLEEILNEVIPGVSIKNFDPQIQIIFLRNERGYNCPICKKIHEHENPYIRICSRKQVKFFCRRTGPNEEGEVIGSLSKFYNSKVKVKIENPEEI